MTALLAAITSGAGLYLTIALAVLVAVGAVFLAGRSSGRGKAQLAAERAQAAQEAKVVQLQAQAWKAEAAVPEDPDVVLKEHKL